MYPLDHELVPEHVLPGGSYYVCVKGEIRRCLSKEEVARQPWSRVNLPCIRRSDPIAQYLGLLSGDVVRINRLDGTVYFRQVVS